MKDDKLNYPRFPHNQDRRRVLTEREIIEMREQRNEGLSSRAIAANFAVSKTIVLYWTNDELYREKVNKKRWSIIKQKEKTSKVYKDHRKEEKRRWQKDALKRSEEKRKYKGKKTYQWKKRRLNKDEEFKKKTNEQALSAYHRKKNEANRQRLNPTRPTNP